MKRGDRVGLYLEPWVAQVVSFFAIGQSGAVFVPINALLFPDQVAHIAADCGMRAVVTTGSRLAAIRNAMAGLPTLEFFVTIGDGASPESPRPTHDFERLCGLTPDPDRRDACIEKDLAAILYTSGSTGKPKGVMLTHAQIMAGSPIVPTYLGISESERILAVPPLRLDPGLNPPDTALQNRRPLGLF